MAEERTAQGPASAVNSARRCITVSAWPSNTASTCVVPSANPGGTGSPAESDRASDAALPP